MGSWVIAGALKVVATAEDSRPRVIRATKEWNWRPLVSILEHEDVRLGCAFCN